jgi:DNA invertase Pin-like site-specific DNA recombinase
MLLPSGPANTRGLCRMRIVVYKVDRFTRSLADFAKLVELFDGHGMSFVSVTQQFNTTTSMGRLTLNVLLSFAQFEREVTSERIRDKIAASKRKGLWVGAWSRSDTRPRTARSWSSRTRPSGFGSSSGAISSLAAYISRWLTFGSAGL